MGEFSRKHFLTPGPLTRHLQKLAIPLGDSPPAEFRLFVSGWNKTENGEFLFDQAAADAVMAAYQAHAVDRMIDLEHLSLDPEARHYDPDARGWAKLELRADGSLWAVDVRWTADGAARLNEKRQRFVSPAFEIDPESRRVTKIINIAMTALPATHQTPALIAARVHREMLSMMDPKLAAEALDALQAGDQAKCEELLKSMIVSAASGEGEAAPAAEPMAEAVPAAEEEDEEKKEYAAVAASLVRLSGKPSYTAALAEVEEWKRSHLELASERDRLAKEKAALETSERRGLVAQLVKLGAEIPATAWSDDSATKPCARLAAEPLDELKARVAKLSAARGGKAPSAPAAPRAEGPHGLSARELELCSQMGCSPEKYAALKAQRDAARSAGGN